MSYHEILEMLFERNNELETLWTIYLTFVGAILAFLATNTRPSRTLSYIAIMGFAALAASNLLAMRGVTDERQALYAALQAYPSPVGEKVWDLGESKAPPQSGRESTIRSSLENAAALHVTTGNITVFHIAVDFLMLATIVLLSKWKQRP